MAEDLRERELRPLYHCRRNETRMHFPIVELKLLFFVMILPVVAGRLLISLNNSTSTVP